MRRHLLLLAAVALAVAACAPASPVTSPAASPPSPDATPGGSPSAVRPIVIDTDLGADDVTALAILLREPSVDVRAITVSGTGLVHCGPGLRNLRNLLAAFGRSEVPIGCGRETAEGGRPFPDEWRGGADALYGVQLPPTAGTSLGGDAPTVIAEAVPAADGDVTIVALGPWTNLADAFAADPGLADRIAGIHAMAGTIDAPGNVFVDDLTTGDRVEWNVVADPAAFGDVLELGLPTSLVPLDATDDVPVPPDIADRLAPDHAAAGADIVYELYLRSPFLTADSQLWDQLAALALIDPDIVAWDTARLRVEPDGRLVRDDGGTEVRYAASADPERTVTAMLAALRRGPGRPEPFDVAGMLTVVWDGAACRIEGAPPTRAGTALAVLRNTSTEDAALLIAGVDPSHPWSDVMALLPSIEFDDPSLEIPDWVHPVEGGASAPAGGEGTWLTVLPSGTVGALCATGTWPDFTFFDAGSFDLAE